MNLFLHEFLTLLDIDALCGIGDMPAAQIIDSRGCHIGSGKGLYGGIVAVQSGDGEAATCVMGEPDKVALAVDGDSGDLVEGDAGVVDVVGVPVGAVEAGNADIACGGQPLVGKSSSCLVPKS